jgi:hypothetical protein
MLQYLNSGVLYFLLPQSFLYKLILKIYHTIYYRHCGWRGGRGGGEGKAATLGLSGLSVDCHLQRHKTKRRATQHGCRPSLLGDWDKGIEIVYGEENQYCILYKAD